MEHSPPSRASRRSSLAGGSGVNMLSGGGTPALATHGLSWSTGWPVAY